MIDYDSLIAKTPTGIWLSGAELGHLWGVDKRVQRLRTTALVEKGKFHTKGTTANRKYKIKTKASKTFTGVIPTTGNGVIDAKLRKKAKLPDTPSSLENLIRAATNVGTENEVLKQALNEIDAIIAKVREHL